MGAFFFIFHSKTIQMKKLINFFHKEMKHLLLAYQKLTDRYSGLKVTLHHKYSNGFYYGYFEVGEFI